MGGWTAAWLWTLLGCGGEAVPEPSAGGDVIRIAGADELVDTLGRRLAEARAKQDPNVRFDISGGGTAAAMKRLLAGEVDIAVASRRASPAEREQAKVNGYDLAAPEARHLVAVDVVAVAVSAQNPIDSLTYDQVIGIFCTGNVDNWSYIGQGDVPIHPVVREPTAGSRAVFEDFFCGPKGIAPNIPVMNAEQIREHLATDPGGITFVSLSEQAGKVLGLRRDKLAHPLLPSQQNVTRGAYPLYYDVWLYTPGAPKGATQAFLDWVVTPAGQDIVDEARYVPLYLRPDRSDEPRPLRETIHFEPGSHEPNPRSKARLEFLVEELRDRSGEYHHVVLEGYTDAQETDPLSLSEARAAAVRDLLKKELPHTFFEIIPRGAENPIAPNSTPYGRQENRRVQIYLEAEAKEDAAVVNAQQPPP